MRALELERVLAWLRSELAKQQSRCEQRRADSRSNKTVLRVCSGRLLNRGGK